MHGVRCIYCCRGYGHTTVAKVRCVIIIPYRPQPQPDGHRKCLDILLSMSILRSQSFAASVVMSRHFVGDVDFAFEVFCRIGCSKSLQHYDKSKKANSSHRGVILLSYIRSDWYSYVLGSFCEQVSDGIYS
jgi:hypothetical protein